MKRLFLTILILLFCSTVYADSEGPNSPGTMADDDTVGTTTWTNPDNAKTSDNSYASATSPSHRIWRYSHYLKATNFGFAIPVGATINGIVVEIEKKSDDDIGGDLTIDSEVKIVKSDSTIGAENKASGDDWPLSDTYSTYGAFDDLWNESWSAEDINNANFGIVLSTKWYEEDIHAYVDHIRITVYYTEVPSVTILYNAVIENAVIN